jgi:uncharacterized repeat protein (TIGR01451 family)
MSKLDIRGALSRLAVVGSAAVLTSGAAYAANTLTEAGTSVSNTFELSYEVSDVVQPVITNNSVSPPVGAIVQGTPTLFTVDRKVDLIVTATNSTLNSPPGATAVLTYTLLNEGNDTQAYSFSIEDLDNAAGTFDATTVTISYLLDADDDGLPDDGAFTTIAATAVGTAAGSANFTPDVPKGTRVFLQVSGVIAASVNDLETDDITIVAETRDPTAWANVAETGAVSGAVTAADTGSNDIELTAQNVLADGTGVAAAEAAGDSDGLYAATGIIEVESPDLDATKTVTAIKEPGIADPFVALTDCATATAVPDAKAIPGSCVEYVIQVENTGSAAADTLIIDDILPAEVTFISAEFSDAAPGTGFDDDPDVAGAGPILSAPTTPAASDCNGTTTCVIQLSDALLPAGRTGTITIRALVK